MAWGGNGITNLRRLLDQSAIVNNWGASAQRVTTKAFNQVGYLRRLLIKVPIQAGTLTVTAANPVAAQAATQRPAFRAIQAFDITAQGISPFYQLLKGTDIAYLEYVNNGEPIWNDTTLGAFPDVAPGSPVGYLGRIAVSLAAIGYQVTAAAISATSQNVQFSGVYDFPLTEFVKFPEYTQQTQNGTVTVPAQEVEVGLVTLQNTQQNITPHMTLNPLYSLTVDSPYLSSATQPSASAFSPLVEFYTEFYDVPVSPADQPPGYAQLFIITRTSTDDTVGAGNVVHTFAPAGLLLRAIYTFYDVNDNLIDISAQGIQVLTNYPLLAQVQEGVISFAWGSTVYKKTERFSMNLIRAVEMYGDLPPPGALFHDFFRDHTVTDVINTAVLPSVRGVMTGLPASVTNCHTIEERMIPVKLG